MKRECVVRDVTILDLIFYIVYLYGIASRWFLSRFLGYARNDKCYARNDKCYARNDVVCRARNDDPGFGAFARMINLLEWIPAFAGMTGECFRPEVL